MSPCGGVFAQDRGTAHASKDLAENLARPAVEALILAAPTHGPTHDELGIAMDMSTSMKAKRGAICTVSLSFNNDVNFEPSSDTSVTTELIPPATTTCATVITGKST